MDWHVYNKLVQKKQYCLNPRKQYQPPIPITNRSSYIRGTTALSRQRPNIVQMEEYYKEAKKIVKKKKSFYGNFTSWLIMSIFFFVLNMTTGAHFHWWIFPVLGWGIGVAYQYVDTFGVFNSKNWEKNEIEKEMTKLYSKDRYKANKEGLSLDEIPNREALDIPDFDELKREWDDQEFV